MTSAEIEHRPQADLQAQWGYAKALAGAGTLPKAYRDRPSDLLLAMAYGEALGLKLTTVLNGVHIIDGKPSMSSQLMQALIMSAGHRVRVQGDSTQATCVIVRRDDPEFAFSATFTMNDARLAKLVPGKPDSNWAKYPRAMLKARAISECAREACPDVLAGVSYTPEELGDTSVMVDAMATAPRRPTEPMVDVPLPPEDTTGAPERAQERPAPSFVGEDTTQAEAYGQEWEQAWLVDLAQAVEQQDLAGIQILAQRAAAGGQARLLEGARKAWAAVQEQLAQQEQA